MALITPLSPDSNKEVAQLAKYFNETLGSCPNSILTMKVRPAIAKAFIGLNKAVMENKGRVTSGLKRMVGYMTSYTAGCQYCQSHAVLATKRYGAHEEKMNNIWDYKTHPVFTAVERTALDFAVATASIPNTVDDELSSNLNEHWDEGEIVEILGVISLFGFLNRWNDSMATEMEEGAVLTGKKYLAGHGWPVGKHR